MMNPDVEQIVSSDEVARATVERAEKDAAELIGNAREKADSMQADLEKKILEIERREIEPILTEGRQQAQKTIEETEQYIARLRQKVALKKTAIISAFISNIAKTG